MTLKSEVLPAPLGPMTANSSPGSTSNEASESALTPSKRTEMFDTESSGARVGSGPFAPLDTLLSLISPTSFRDGAGERYSCCALPPRAGQDKTCARSHLAAVGQQAATSQPYRFPVRSRDEQARAPFEHFVLPVIRQYLPHLSQR